MVRGATGAFDVGAQAGSMLIAANVRCSRPVNLTGLVRSMTGRRDERPCNSRGQLKLESSPSWNLDSLNAAARLALRPTPPAQHRHPAPAHARPVHPVPTVGRCGLASVQLDSATRVLGRLSSSSSTVLLAVYLLALDTTIVYRTYLKREQSPPPLEPSALQLSPVSPHQGQVERSHHDAYSQISHHDALRT